MAFVCIVCTSCNSSRLDSQLGSRVQNHAYVTEHNLSRFLRAESGNVERAQARLVSHLQWREDVSLRRSQRIVRCRSQLHLIRMRPVGHAVPRSLIRSDLSLCVACCALHVVRCALHVVRCALRVACCMVCVARCMLCAVRCMVCVAWCALCVVRCMLYFMRRLSPRQCSAPRASQTTDRTTCTTAVSTRLAGASLAFRSAHRIAIAIGRCIAWLVCLLECRTKLTVGSAPISHCGPKLSRASPSPAVTDRSLQARGVLVLRARGGSL